MLQTLQANQAFLEDSLASQSAIKSAPLACPKYTKSQAFKLFNSGVKIDLKDIDFDVEEVVNLRDIANDGFVKRWENSDIVWPQYGELIIPYKFAESHFSSTEQDRIKLKGHDGKDFKLISNISN